MPLSQSDADQLIAVEKHFVDDAPLVVTGSGIDISRALISNDGDEGFVLDVWRGSFNLSKYKLQLRGREIVPLVRVDVDGAPHINPDNTRVPTPHIHLYREGYDDEWAYPLSNYSFRDSSDIVKTLEDFAEFCHIQALPTIR